MGRHGHATFDEWKSLICFPSDCFLYLVYYPSDFFPVKKSVSILNAFYNRYGISQYTSMTVRTFNHVQSAHGAAATDLVVKQPPELYRYIQIYTDIYNIIYIYMYIYI